MGSNINNNAIVATTNQRIGAVKKYLASNKTELPAGGELVKAPHILAVFQKALDAHAEVIATRAAYRKAVAERRDAEVERRTIDDAVKGWVLNRFGADSTEAHEFGYAARKPGEKSAETKAHAVELARATRLARGTKGKKQKEKVKGTLIEPTPEAPPAPAAPPSNGASNGAAHLS